jgi:quinoprotein dehydrogenase-associated probable ABC transporter substrate-binding protein
MSSRCPDRERAARAGLRLGPVAVAAIALLALSAARVPAPVPTLRVCGDPNNLPFSNQRREGFENRIAAVLADELHMRVAYTWAPEWRGFVRKGLGAGRCDVIMGIPAESDRVLPTRPYYTSTYVFLSRRDRHLDIRSLDDPRLRHLRIGIHFIGDDYVNPPPAHSLARRGIVRNIVGYSIYGDYSRPNPPSDLVRAVARGDVDLAIVWGPFAGYFGGREGVPLRIEPVTPAIDPPGLRYTFAIAMGVRRDDAALGARLDSALARRRPEIERILRAYHVPLVTEADTRSDPRRCPAAKEKSCA